MVNHMNILLLFFDQNLDKDQSVVYVTYRDIVNGQ
jgi:hypothetical protein